MARIDRLDEQTKSTLQTASVIGRSFYYRILERISDSAITLDKQCGSLERAELLREAGRMPELEYMFKHDLARDAAYGSILNRKRASSTSASPRRSRRCSRIGWRSTLIASPSTKTDIRRFVPNSFCLDFLRPDYRSELDPSRWHRRYPLWLA